MGTPRPQACVLCDGPVSEMFVLRDAPTLQNVLYETRAEALAAPRWTVDLKFCARCRFAFNPEFDPEAISYDLAYDNDQTASARYREHVEATIEHLAGACRIGAGSEVLEIGCGNGYFLSRLAERSGARVQGFDPAYNGRHGSAESFHRGLFRPVEGYRADLVVLRHCLEGFVDPDAVLETVRQSLGPEGRIYLEGGDLDYILTSGDFTLLYHECPRYFSAASLGVFLARHGLAIEGYRTTFGGQFYACIARPVPGPERLSETEARLRERLANCVDGLIWGIGGRAVTLLTHLGLSTDRVPHAVDLATARHGLHVPVTGQRIAGPEEVAGARPGLVIVANRNYLDEIRAHFPPETEFIVMGEDPAPV